MKYKVVPLANFNRVCSVKGCCNKAEFALKTSLPFVTVHFCKSCLAELSAAAGKSSCPKSPPNKIKKMIDKKSEEIYE